MKRTNRSVLAVTIMLAGCTRDAPRAEPSERPVSQPAPVAQPTGIAPPAMTAPAPVAPPADSARLEGTVVETMDAGGYTYAKLDSGAKPVWVAGPETKLAVGMKLGAMSGTLMTGFRSSTLNRTFDEIYFIASFPISGAAIPAKPAPMTATEKIEPAAGGQTIAQVFANVTSLAGKPVVVRGKVVKVNNQILDHNWLHIQDGTGAAGTNDLTVTTAATVALGDVVVVRGKLVTNKDFGAGYTYAVLIEEAAVSPK
jgi:hypothetical protein